MTREDRITVANVIEKHGGKFSGEMRSGICTHLISDTSSGEKYRKAITWSNIAIVNSKWLEASVERGYRLPESKYRVVLCSTPQRSQPSPLHHDVSIIAGNAPSIFADGTFFGNLDTNKTAMRSPTPLALPRSKSSQQTRRQLSSVNTPLRPKSHSHRTPVVVEAPNDIASTIDRKRSASIRQENVLVILESPSVDLLFFQSSKRQTNSIVVVTTDDNAPPPIDDSPGQFLDSNRVFKPRFDLTKANDFVANMAAVQSTDSPLLVRLISAI